MSGREMAEALITAYWPGPCPPYWPLWPWTSAERRWSQLCRVKMRRHGPHPRPWEGQLWEQQIKMGTTDFSGLFFGVDHPAEIAGTPIDASGISVREALERFSWGKFE